MKFEDQANEVKEKMKKMCEQTHTNTNPKTIITIESQTEIEKN